MPVEGKRIAILTGASIRSNPRVFKEASTLSRNGCDVIVLGAEFDRRSVEESTAFAVRHGFVYEAVGVIAEPLGIPSVYSSLRRLRTRLGHAAFRTFNFENRYQLGYVLPELLARAFSLSVDYYIAHLEQGLWVGAQLHRAGHRVGVDFEDWYSEDLLPEDRKGRPLRLLRLLEGTLLGSSLHSSCPSAAMRDVLASAYDCNPPEVIYNAFPWSDRDQTDKVMKDRRNPAAPTIHWYSQTLGPGRGLEDLLAALPHIQSSIAEVHLRGYRRPGFTEWLHSLLPEEWRQRVLVHDTVSNEELLSRISEHSIGFAGEMKESRSRDLTVTNKILHYLLGGLAVVASDTSGQREVASRAGGAVLLYPAGDFRKLAVQLNGLLQQPDRLREVQSLALKAAEQEFCWERMAPRFLGLVESALDAEAAGKPRKPGRQ